MRGVIVYYSHSGNTRQIASFMAEYLGIEICEIKTKEGYLQEDIIEQGKRQIEQNFSPEINEINQNIQDADFILLGCPIWWYTFAPAVKTFLENHDLSGKIIYPFTTSSGWKGHIFRDIEKLAKNAIVKQGLYLHYDGDMLVDSNKIIEKWLDNIKKEMKN